MSHANNSATLSRKTATSKILPRLAKLDESTDCALGLLAKSVDTRAGEAGPCVHPPKNPSWQITASDFRLHRKIQIEQNLILVPPLLIAAAN
jgi:hypothetical protein